jgi:predicted porin
MNKKLLAVAVAGALAAPVAALAQSSVTISGNFKVSWESLKISGMTAAGAAA